MAVTAKELIEYLKTIPAETELYVLKAYDCGYSGTCAEFVPLVLNEFLSNVEYFESTESVPEPWLRFGDV